MEDLGWKTNENSKRKKGKSGTDAEGVAAATLEEQRKEEAAVCFLICRALVTPC